MKALAWGDELCGVKVTPEAWDGGITELKSSPRYRCRRPGVWKQIKLKYAGSGDDRYVSVKPAADCHVPIYPPRGWAGKSEAELWIAMECGLGAYGNDIYNAWDFGGVRVSITEGGEIGLQACEHEPDIGCCPPFVLDDPQPIILALQNAQVLSRRRRRAMKVNLELEFGNRTCAVEPGKFCYFAGTRRCGTEAVCMLFNVQCLTGDDGWLERCHECMKQWPPEVSDV